LNRLIATKILADTGPTTNLSLTEAEVNAAVRGGPAAARAIPEAPPAVGTELVRLSNPRHVDEGRGRGRRLVADAEPTGAGRVGPFAKYVIRTPDGRLASGDSLSPIWENIKPLMLSGEPQPSGTEVWIAAPRGGSPLVPAERISNVVTVP